MSQKEGCCSGWMSQKRDVAVDGCPRRGVSQKRGILVDGCRSGWMSQKIGVAAMSSAKEGLSTKRMWGSVQKTHWAPLKTHLKLTAEVIDHLGDPLGWGSGLETLGPGAGCFQVNPPKVNASSNYFLKFNIALKFPACAEAPHAQERVAALPSATYR